MSTLIGKFTKDGLDYYFDYSTETRQPQQALLRDEYRERYGKLHGRVGLAKLPDRLQRADAKGTSARNRTDLDDMLKGNRAGEGDKELTTQEVIDLLLLRRTQPAPAP